MWRVQVPRYQIQVQVQVLNLQVQVRVQVPGICTRVVLEYKYQVLHLCLQQLREAHFGQSAGRHSQLHPVSPVGSILSDPVEPDRSATASTCGHIT